ncbi:cobW-domain-containing protein [Amylocystis lapponica]|nr:cobW-domain-containing protein [Amylocystis lapponica]
MSSQPNIPITVFTGFLGAGKTSIILSLLPKLPKDYRVVLLKNEFGDVEVDSQLAKQSSLTAVSEILNGCMCCILVGQMKTALLEIRESSRSSGSAFPATLAFQIRELERETEGDLKLDAIVTVIDAENFSGYEDTSPTAKMQASYTDVILINKWEYISERALDVLVDHLNTLNDTTPKIRCKGRDGVDPALILGLDSKLFETADKHLDVPQHDEVETATVYRGTGALPRHHHHDAHCACAPTHTGHGDSHGMDTGVVEDDTLDEALRALSKETVWRVKGFVRLARGICILNWAFGRYELTLLDGKGHGDEEDDVKLTRAARKFAERLGASVL